MDAFNELKTLMFKKHRVEVEQAIGMFLTEIKLVGIEA